MNDQSNNNVVMFTRAKIEDILEGIVESLAENRALVIPLRSRRSGNENPIRFPANTRAEVKRFTCVLQVLHMCHEALVSGHVVTKRSGLSRSRNSFTIGTLSLNNRRNIYYQNSDLFGSQQYVDTLVDDIAFTFGVGRNVLNVVAAYKGLIAGGVTIELKNNSAVHCNSDGNGALIPRAEVIRRLDIDEVKWIMVIEKEATFRGLAASRYFETSAAGPGVLITGKGYPDLVTRQFLHNLHSTFSQVPIHALVDFDPSGIEIMLTYKRGSQGLAHEENVAVPGLSWLGPKSCDILGHSNRGASVTHSSQSHQASALAPPASQAALPCPSASGRVLSTNPLEVSSHLTTLDRRKAINLLRKLHSEHDENVDEISLMYELQLMLMLNIKAEIQAVHDAGNLTRWLDEKLSHGHL
ncbi:DNA topoisomerase IV, alpha subunit [Hypoxylon sp. FL0543]|nr:DNA topoisomerase IV, alpha subunit [Hypoxylon sp. FL0543]